MAALDTPVEHDSAGVDEMRDFYENAPCGYHSLDRDGVFIRINDTFLSWLGYSRDEIIGKRTFRSVLTPASRELFRVGFPAFKERGWTRDAEFEMVRKDGTILPVLLNATVVKDSAGGYLMSRATVFDITERRRAEEALCRSEEMYRSLVENVDAGIALIDSNYTVVAINPAQARMFGKARNELIGKTCFREFEKRDTVCPGCHGAAAMATGRPTERQRQGVRDDGSRFDVRVKAFPLYGPDGAATGFVELVEDISERNRSQEMLRQAKEAAEAANRAKSEFLTNMSHEIRTPLTAILGYADILCDNPDLDEVGDAAKTIKRNGEHLLQLISDILDLSKIEAARLEPTLSHCAPRQIIEEVARLMRVRIDAKALRLAIEFDGPLPETIRTDPLRLRQILINLVGNAVKFTETGSVRIVTRLTDADDRGPKLTTDVIDTGIGLDEKQISLLFQPFSQIDGSTQRKFGGSGLGLAISKRLATMLGGDITVSSTPGKGSTFRVTVATGPLDTAPSVDPAPTAVAIPATPAVDKVTLACRLLLVEDGPDNQRLISFVLRKAGAEVTVAGNGQVAVDCAAVANKYGKPFHVILMDMQMPVLDGYEAAARLRSEGYTGPIIALTAHAMPEDRQRCLDAGCDDYITKPIAPRELVRLVGAHLGNDERRVSHAPQA